MARRKTLAAIDKEIQETQRQLIAAKACVPSIRIPQFRQQKPVFRNF